MRVPDSFMVAGAVVRATSSLASTRRRRSLVPCPTWQLGSLAQISMDALEAMKVESLGVQEEEACRQERGEGVAGERRRLMPIRRKVMTARIKVKVDIRGGRDEALETKVRRSSLRSRRSCVSPVTRSSCGDVRAVTSKGRLEKQCSSGLSTLHHLRFNRWRGDHVENSKSGSWKEPSSRQSSNYHKDDTAEDTDPESDITAETSLTTSCKEQPNALEPGLQSVSFHCHFGPWRGGGSPATGERDHGLRRGPRGDQVVQAAVHDHGVHWQTPESGSLVYARPSVAEHAEKRRSDQADVVQSATNGLPTMEVDPHYNHKTTTTDKEGDHFARDCSDRKDRRGVVSVPELALPDAEECELCGRRGHESRCLDWHQGSRQDRARQKGEGGGDEKNQDENFIFNLEICAEQVDEESRDKKGSDSCMVRVGCLKQQLTQQLGQQLTQQLGVEEDEGQERRKQLWRRDRVEKSRVKRGSSDQQPEYSVSSCWEKNCVENIAALSL
jgi:hypothetical protein